MQKLALVCGTLALMSTASADQGTPAVTLLVPTELKWTESPSRKGAWMAVVEGDPKPIPEPQK